jgi:multiple RNA-binding domain-containing protein 1
MAVVEYLTPTEAKLGFRNLAYSKFMKVPLFLEWAPEGIFSKKIKKEDSSDVPGEENGAPSLDNEGDDNGNGNILYVKNVNFETTQDKLR